MGILAFVQFMNYLRDSVPVAPQKSPGSRVWYLSFYCQLELGILLPNLSQSIDYMSLAFTSLTNAGRKSESPAYANLLVAKTRLAAMNRAYLLNQDLFEFADWSLRASRDSVCD